MPAALRMTEGRPTTMGITLQAISLEHRAFSITSGPTPRGSPIEIAIGIGEQGFFMGMCVKLEGTGNPALFECLEGSLQRGYLIKGLSLRFAHITFRQSHDREGKLLGAQRNGDSVFWLDVLAAFGRTAVDCYLLLLAQPCRSRPTFRDVNFLQEKVNPQRTSFARLHTEAFALVSLSTSLSRTGFVLCWQLIRACPARVEFRASCSSYR